MTQSLMKTSITFEMKAIGVPTQGKVITKPLQGH